MRPSRRPQEVLLAQSSGPVLLVEQGVDNVIAHLLCCIICVHVRTISLPLALVPPPVPPLCLPAVTAEDRNHD